MGSTYVGENRCEFRVWAPQPEQIALHLVSPHDRFIPLERDDRGYAEVTVDGAEPGTLYYYRLDERDRPDPASRFQPGDVHGPSQIVADDFVWSDAAWRGVPIEEYIGYELHIGTFSHEGTFDGAIRWLDELRDLGITAVEIMPVAQFPGARNWGYDGVYPFAPQCSYGGPAGLKRLVDACHRRGLAAILDVVYNHLWPEGNYFPEFGPYFTDRYCTPWGRAINFDGRGSDEVRRFFLENVLYWIEEFHFDALRLDAVHSIFDQSAQPFLAQVAAAVRDASRRLGRHIYAIPESDLNDSRIVHSADRNGFGFPAQWSDDFHHAVHTLLTGESGGYYADFGRLDHLTKAFHTGFVYTGEYSPARGRSHGNSSEQVEAHQLVTFIQNHDQVGNRMLGERLGHLTSFEAEKLAAGVVLLSPFLPLIFMGEEYGEDAPFLYFVSHSDPDLVEAVRKGRAAEFSSFCWSTEPPDPQSDETFLRSKLDHKERHEGRHRTLWEFHRDLIRLRKTHPALRRLSKKQMEVRGEPLNSTMYWRRWDDGDEAVAAFHFGDQPETLDIPVPRGRWRKEICSADRRWGGEHDSAEFHDSSGSIRVRLPRKSFVVYSREANGRP